MTERSKDFHDGFTAGLEYAAAACIKQGMAYLHLSHRHEADACHALAYIIRDEIKRRPPSDAFEAGRQAERDQDDAVFDAFVQHKATGK